MSVGDLCQRDPVIARPDESAREVAVRMDRVGVGSAVVVDLAERPIGIVTDRDLAMKVLRRRKDPDTTPVRAVMNDDVVTVRESAPLVRAFNRMRQDGIRRIPVTNADGELAGILTWDDALQVIADEVAGAAAVARTQMQNSRQRAKSAAEEGAN